MLFFKRRVPFLIVGHPRCGTTSAAEICRQMGFDVGDEWVGEDGVSSWMMAVKDKRNPYSMDKLGRSRKYIRWDHLILVVRDLKNAVPSVMIENRHAAPSHAFRQKWVKAILGIDLSDSPDEMTAAIQSIVSWCRIILNQGPVLQFRIEDQQGALRAFLTTTAATRSSCNSNLGNVNVNAAKLYDGVRHDKPSISLGDWARLSPDVKRDVTWYCETFGYENPINPTEAV